MSVEARFRLTDAPRTSLTMELTMTLCEWTQLRTALDAIEQANSYPFHTLRQRISSLEGFATKHFIAPTDVPEAGVLESVLTPDLLAKWPEFSDPKAIAEVVRLMQPKDRKFVADALKKLTMASSK